jgi:transposase-like protein
MLLHLLSRFNVGPLDAYRHSTEFKHELIGLCQPGISVSAAALAHGVNSNLVRRWTKQLPVDARLDWAQCNEQVYE